MTYLSADDILKAADLPVEDVEVPEWGGVVRVRGMSGADRNAWEASNLERRGDQMIPVFDNNTAKLVARCIVDDKGERMFTDQQIWELGHKKSAKALNRVADVARRLSGLGDEAEEEALGNSVAAPSGSSTSSSPKKSSTSL